MQVVTWEAERFEEEKQSGRTRPLVIECSRTVVDPDRIRDGNLVATETISRLMLVKSVNTQLDSQGLFSELYGNMLARELGVYTPEPGFVNISPEFVDSLQMTPTTRNIRISPGIGIGCEYMRGLAPIVPSASHDLQELADIQAIYGVDMLIQNPDRRTGKPNCSSHQGRILAYDFELGFSFLLPLFFAQKPGAWEVDKQGIHSDHFFHKELKQRQAELDWSPFIDRLRQFTPDWLTAFFIATPEPWRGYADRVIRHMNEIHTNLEDFESALIRSLS